MAGEHYQSVLLCQVGLAVLQNGPRTECIPLHGVGGEELVSLTGRLEVSILTLHNVIARPKSRGSAGMHAIL